ncbi:hypothetical protein N7539_000673 [Penicillium diatomitis]|uniref:F-box domain-containing protein n=1 Tax=Penicillium diatomitis TaxID=2819901 RepID=A0A9W9XM43_9EURO|nr:uncharacterized protein N7539_000673 [Penicillium diatomitis]KAJ5495557.1 hypothetical protein N7539_000673 [Penicillium diatomitis]
MGSRTAESAFSRAFALPEIILAIMHQMDMRTLINCQRVSHNWATLIRHSASLQRALYFLPREAPSRKPVRVYNELLAEIFPSCFPAPGAPDQELELTSITFVDDPETLKVFLRPEASWRRMLTTQPPIHTVGTFVAGTTESIGLRWQQSKAEPLPDGLRMGVLFETLLSVSEWTWQNETTWIARGGTQPVNATEPFVQPSDFMRVDDMNADWERTIRDLDLVIVTFGHADDSAPEDSDLELLHGADAMVWRKLRAAYKELGLTVGGLVMEKYNEGTETWH